MGWGCSGGGVLGGWGGWGWRGGGGGGAFRLRLRRGLMPRDI